MRNFIVGFLFCLVLLLFGFRTATPPTFTDLTDKNQITAFNNFLKDIHKITNGRYSADVKASDPTNPSNGDFWILESGSTHKFKWRAGGVTYGVTGT